MEIEKFLKQHEIVSYALIPFSGPTITHEDVKKNCLVDIDVNSDCKTIILVDKSNEKHYAVLLEAYRKLNVKRVKSIFSTSSKLSILDKNDLWKRYNTLPGQVCPFFLKGIPLIVDTNVLSHKKIHFGSGHGAIGLQVQTDDLLKILNPIVDDITSDLKKQEIKIKFIKDRSITDHVVFEDLLVSKMQEMLANKPLYYLGLKLDEKKKLVDYGITNESPIEVLDKTHIFSSLTDYIQGDSTLVKFSDLSEFDIQYLVLMANEMSLKLKTEENTYYLERKYKKKGDAPITEILPNLFLGSIKDAKNHDLLMKHKITRILNVTTSTFDSQVHVELIPMRDVKSFKIESHFDVCHDFIEKSLLDSHGVLVHCVVGRSRSPTVIISYLMRHHKMNLKDAFDFVKIKREIVRPNDGFVRELMEYEKKLFKCSETSLAWKFKFDKSLILNQMNLIELPQENLSELINFDELLLLQKESGVKGFEKNQISDFIKFSVPILTKKYNLINKPAINKFLLNWFVSNIKN